MTETISKLFELLAIGFDKIPVLNKIKGLRAILGFVGLGVLVALKSYGVLTDPTIIKMLEAGLIVWTGLALNAKGRE